MSTETTELRLRHRHKWRRPRPRVSLLSRYILKETAVPAFLAFVLIAFVGVGSELRERSDDLPIEFISTWDLIRLTVLFVPTLVAFIIAITYMVGILMAFGRLSRDGEIMAMQAAGIPLKGVVMPVVVVGALLSVCAFLLQECVQPAALKRANTLIYQELPERITLEVLPTGVMHSVGDLRVYIGGRDPETKTLHDISIFMPTDSGQGRAYYAESAQFRRDGDRLSLFIPRGHLIGPSGDNVARTIITDFTIPLTGPSSLKVPSLRRTKTVGQLLAQENEDAAAYESAKTRSAEKELRKLRLEIAERFSLPFAALAVSFAAAPFAVRSRRQGRSYGFAIGFFLILSYYVLRIMIEPNSLKSLAETVARAMAPNIVLGVIGLWALWRVDRI